MKLAYQFAGLVAFGFVWHAYGFWWGVLSVWFWPVWVGYEIAVRVG